MLPLIIIYAVIFIIDIYFFSPLIPDTLTPPRLRRRRQLIIAALRHAAYATCFTFRYFLPPPMPIFSPLIFAIFMARVARK
jgi:hypothetical protein